MSATVSGWDSEVTVAMQALGVAELRKVLCGHRGGRLVSEGYDTVFVYLGT